MTDPIETLMQEHRAIERVLDALCVFASAAASGGDADPADLPRFVDFIRELADRKHHAKEETILFVAMTDNGFPREAGPIAVMLHEHEVGRALVAQLVPIAPRAAWTDDDRAVIARVATEFSDMLRAHIQKEDNILYTMARDHLPAEVMADVAERVAAVERDYAERGETARLDELGTALCARYAG